MEQARGLTGVVYGRRMYEVMRYWEDDLPDWDAQDRDFASMWRSQRKWVASRSLKSVGPNATLIGDDFEAVIRRLKAELDGEIDVAGPNLAGSLAITPRAHESRIRVQGAGLYCREVGRGAPMIVLHGGPDLDIS